MSDNIVEQRLKRRAVCLTVAANARNTAQGVSGPTGGENFRAVYGRGLMWSDSGVVSLDNELPPNLEYESVRNRSGQWFAAFHRGRDDTYRFIADFMGYYRLYYATFKRGDDQIAVVGDNQTSVVAELRRLGRPVSIDWPVAASHLLSTHTIMQSSYTQRTMFDGIRSLPAGAELVVGPDEVREEHRELFTAPPGSAYEDLLAAGICRAQQQLRTLAASPVGDKRHALSGGRDSRIAMAMTVSASVHEEFAMMTADPRTSRRADSKKVLEKDLQVAVGLRRYLGLGWARETGIVGLRHDIHSSLDIFQSRYAGARFTWPGSTVATWPKALRLEVHGGSGELIRRAYQNMRDHRSFRPLADRPDTVADDARQLFPTVVRHQRHLPDDLREEATEVFVDSMSLDDESPLSEQLNLHYANFRNRDHFGEVVHRYARNALVLYPLAQPEFLQASRLLGPEARSRGQVAYDIIRMTCPALNEFAFDDGHWQEPFRLNRTERLRGPEPFDSRDIQDFYDNEDADTRLRASTTLLTDPSTPQPAIDNVGAATSMAANSIWELLEQTDSPLRTLDTVVPTLLAQNSLVPGPTAAKLETMSSVYTGRHTPYESILLANDRSGTVMAVSGTEAWHTACTETIRLRRADPFIFNVGLRILEHEAVATIRCNSDEVSTTEWAIYLYQEQTKIAERWYDTDVTARFPLEDVADSSRFRALVFSRRRGQGDRLLRRFSEWRTVEDL